MYKLACASLQVVAHNCKYTLIVMTLEAITILYVLPGWDADPLDSYYMHEAF